MERVVVEPFGEGWAVRSLAADNPMILRRGADAERVGRDLALRLAAAGTPVQLNFRLRDGATAAKFVCLPPAGRDPEPLMIRLRPPAATTVEPVAA